MTANLGRLEKAKDVVRVLIGSSTPSLEQITENVQTAIKVFPDIDPERLQREAESMYRVFVPDATTLDDARGHQEWLPERRSQIDWRFWNRYRKYLEITKRLEPSVVHRLDEITDEVVRRIEDPMRPGAWDRRGMVVGQVQSGKTQNYIGLICKAIDAGYRVIVILAGVHNNLRSQTQVRMDEGVIGFDTQQRRLFDQSNTRVGVGLLDLTLVAHSLTSSADNGDLNLRDAKKLGVRIDGADPVILVVKKNTTVLRNLTRLALNVAGQQDPASGRTVVRGVPLLVIDDEADHASVNTKDVPLDDTGRPIDDQDPTKINGLIRQLLHSFDQSVYIGYTATPFANIFIYKDIESAEFGEDLFPRSFIINLPAPSNYVGPADIFGMKADPAAGLEGQSPLPILRPVHDYEDWVPDRHRKDHVPGTPLPASLKQAIRSFILVCAARAARGESHVHNSMLIHVTRFINVQNRVERQVSEELSDLRQRLRYGDGGRPDQLLDELRTLWESDFCPTTSAFRAHEKFVDDVFSDVSWAAIQPLLEPAAAKIVVRLINGSAKDTLAYIEEKQGLSVIAIGGDKLSRGLTLEGLSVSYYLRATRMYDTLMQMGRWFGYRPGYADLCRLYTTEELARWYQDITAADEELRREFDAMARIGSTPEEYGLRVRSHPDGLMITAAAKMRSGKPVGLSFSATISQTTVFSLKPDDLEDNADATDHFLRSLGTPREMKGDGGTAVWRMNDPYAIAEFLDGFSTHPDARRVQPPVLAKYIRARVRDGELGEWIVALIGVAAGAAKGPSVSVGGVTVNTVVRRPSASILQTDDRYQVKGITSPTDELLDLSIEEEARALEATKRDWENAPLATRNQTIPDRPSSFHIKRVRPSSRGLLLLYPFYPENRETSDPIIGLAVSFPRSQNGEQSLIPYMVNNTYWEQEYGGL